MKASYLIFFIYATSFSGVYPQTPSRAMLCWIMFFRLLTSRSLDLRPPDKTPMHLLDAKYWQFSLLWFTCRESQEQLARSHKTTTVADHYELLHRAVHIYIYVYFILHKAAQTYYTKHTNTKPLTSKHTVKSKN